MAKKENGKRTTTTTKKQKQGLNLRHRNGWSYISIKSKEWPYLTLCRTGRI